MNRAYRRTRAVFGSGDLPVRQQPPRRTGLLSFCPCLPEQHEACANYERRNYCCEK
jgi:hypothetical protein